MTLKDPRLRGGGLGELSRLLSDAMPYPEDVMQCAVRLEVHPGSFRSTGTTDQQWQSLVERADDDPEITITRLVRDVLDFLPAGAKRSSLQTWLARGGRALSRDNAGAECARVLSEVVSFPDPRNAADQVLALSGVLRDIVATLSDHAAEHSEEGVVSAAQRATGAVRRLQAAFPVAESTLARMGASTRPESAFEAELSIIGHLVDAVTLVEREVTRLLGALRALPPG